jgi:hypothetical protein
MFVLFIITNRISNAPHVELMRMYVVAYRHEADHCAPVQDPS